MTNERRYHETEVAEIFEAAASPRSPARNAVTGRGLTLGELQEIGREVGLPPERITEAAAAVDRSRAAVQRQTSFGMPVTAGFAVELPRALTDREWALLVAELREVFSARGRESSDGETRHWSNGNLHAFIEPTLSGYRLRLGTLKGGAAPVNRLGFSGIVLGAAMAGGMLLAGEPLTELVGAALVGGMGGGAVVYNALRLPRWAGRRERQMEHIVERTRAILAAGDARSGDPPAADVVR